MHATNTFLLVWVDDLVGSGDVFCGTLNTHIKPHKMSKHAGVMTASNSIYSTFQMAMRNDSKSAVFS